MEERRTLLDEQGRVSHGEKEETEEKIAQELLEGTPEELKPEHDEDQCEAQILCGHSRTHVDLRSHHPRLSRDFIGRECVLLDGTAFG